MASINASISSTGLISSGDATGNLDLQSNGTTGLSVVTGGKVVLANTALSTASAGTLEYDGGELYFTPLGTQRGLIPNTQFYRLNSTVVGSNATGAQSIFGVGVTVSANTIYSFETIWAISKTAGTTGHTISYSFGGTATLNNISYFASGLGGQASLTLVNTTTTNIGFVTTANATAFTGTQTNATNSAWFLVRGTVSINGAGTFIPQYSLSAAPGGAYSTQIGSYFAIWPLGSAGSNISVGTWA